MAWSVFSQLILPDSMDVSRASLALCDGNRWLGSILWIDPWIECGPFGLSAPFK